MGVSGENWTCGNCGKENRRADQMCGLCKEYPATPDGLTPKQLLRRRSAELSEEFGQPVDLSVYGRGGELTAEEVEHAAAEARAEIEAERREFAARCDRLRDNWQPRPLLPPPHPDELDARDEGLVW